MFKAGDVVECVDDVGLTKIKLGDRLTVGAEQGCEVTFDGQRQDWWYRAARFKLYARIINQNATNEIWERDGQHSVRPLGYGVGDSGCYTWQEPGTWELGAWGFMWLKGAWKGHKSETWQPRTVAQAESGQANPSPTDPYVEARRQLALKLDTEDPEADVGADTERRQGAIGLATRAHTAAALERETRGSGSRFPVEGRCRCSRGVRSQHRGSCRDGADART